MKRIYTYFLLALGLLLVSCNVTQDKQEQNQEPKLVRVLAIGNSFSEDAVEQYLWDIADMDGKQMIIGNLYIGGCTLERHWTNVRDSIHGYRYRRIGLDGERVQTDSVGILTALLSEQWDVVTLQQASGSSGKYETYDPYLTDLIEFIRANTGKDTKIYFHQTWAYPNGSTHEEFPKYGSDRTQMYNAILDCTSRALKEHDLDGLIPSGTAIENARTTLLGEDLTRDGYHMDTHSGRYIVSLTWYETLFGVSCLGNGFTPKIVAPDRRQACQWAAHEAVQNPFQRTDLSMLSNRFEATVDEADAHSYSLPELLRLESGNPVNDVKTWEQSRRKELLSLLEREMFGKAPEKDNGQHFRVLRQQTGALGGLAIRKEIAIYPTADESFSIPLLLYLPASAKGPVPVFLGLNEMGNHAISPDEGITLPDEEKIDWYGDPYRMHARGEDMASWPLEDILGAGYGLATLCKEDIDPDWNDGFRNGIHGLFLKSGQTRTADDEWASLAAWAWGLSRSLDCLEQQEQVNAQKVMLVGSQAMAKAALWASAQDERFALTVSKAAGVGGAALMGRGLGNTLRQITNNHPAYYCRNFFKYALEPETLSFDTHEILALSAPRPLLLISSVQDSLTDPRGEFLALQEASRAYALWGDEEMTLADTPAGTLHESQDLGYLESDSMASLNADDWQRILTFVKGHLKD